MSKLDPDMEALIGGGPSARKSNPSKQVNAALARVTEDRRKDVLLRSPDRLQLQDIHLGVPVSTLSQIFRMDVATVKKRLANCPPKEARKAGYLYDIAQASAYLVKPVFDVESYISTMKPSELPSQLQQAFWDAALKKQKWEENAGDLWRTSAVQEALADVFKLIKQTVQLWTETVSETVSIDDAVRAVLMHLSDDLQQEIYKALVENVRKKRTLPIAAELEEEDAISALV